MLVEDWKVCISMEGLVMGLEEYAQVDRRCCRIGIEVCQVGNLSVYCEVATQSLGVVNLPYVLSKYMEIA